MTKDPNASSGGSEHTANARPSTKEKHEAGQSRRKQSRGGEAGDQRRLHPRKRPEGWRGGWPPIKPKNMSQLIVQVGLRSQSSRVKFRAELEFWAAQSRIVESWAIEAGESELPYWNLHVQTNDLSACWRSLRHLVMYYEKQYRGQCRRMGEVLSDFEKCPPTIIVASSDEHWGDYLLVHHTDPSVEDDESLLR